MSWWRLGWAGGHHSAFFCVTSSLAFFIISGIRPGRATAQDTKLRETRACLLGKLICLMPVCRILNQTKESTCAQIKQLPTVSSGVHSCGKNIYPLVIVVPVMINKNKTAPNKQNFFAADSQGCQKRHCWKMNNKNLYDCLWCPAAVVQCWECSSQTICLFLSIS